MYLNRLCLLKLVCKSVANACRRKLCDGTVEGFGTLIGAANVQLPVRAFLSVRDNSNHRLRRYEHRLLDRRCRAGHAATKTTFLVHALHIRRGTTACASRTRRSGICFVARAPGLARLA